LLNGETFTCVAAAEFYGFRVADNGS
jgi:hypothetical protein